MWKFYSEDKGGLCIFAALLPRGEGALRGARWGDGVAARSAARWVGMGWLRSEERSWAEGAICWFGNCGEFATIKELGCWSPGWVGEKGWKKFVEIF